MNESSSDNVMKQIIMYFLIWIQGMIRQYPLYHCDTLEFSNFLGRLVPNSAVLIRLLIVDLAL